MAPELDPAILKALSLETSNTTLAAHGRSGFAFTGKVTSLVDGNEKLFFVKTGKGRESEVMFAGICNFLQLFPDFLSNVSLLARDLLLTTTRGAYVLERNPRCGPQPVPKIVFPWPTLHWCGVIPCNRIPEPLLQLLNQRFRTITCPKTGQAPLNACPYPRWLRYDHVWIPCPNMLRRHTAGQLLQIILGRIL